MEVTIKIFIVFGKNYSKCLWTFVIANTACTIYYQNKKITVFTKKPATKLLPASLNDKKLFT